MHTSSQRPAFANIEMFLVLAIIAILAAVLFPVFSHAREQARRISCLSQEKSLGLSLLMYMQDYDETQPRCQNYLAHTSWRQDVLPYFKKYVKTNAETLACPTNPNRGLRSRNNPETRNDDSDIHLSYALNNNDANGVGGACNRKAGAVSLANITSPAQVIGMVESTAYYSDFVVTASVEEEGGKFHANDSTGKTGHLFTHHGRSNFWFMDGHAKSMKPLDTMNEVDPGNSKAPGSTRNLWTIDNSSFTDADHSHSADATPFTFARENLRYGQFAD